MGYNSADKTKKQYVPVSLSFANISDDGTFKLGQMVPKAGCWNSGSDMLQVISDIDASVPIKYVYYGEWEYASEDQIGWWDSDFNDMYNDAEFPIGTAFLGNFAEKDVQFQQSGSVLIGGTTIDYRPNPEKGTDGKQYVMIGNILPKPIKLGDIKPITGCWNSGSDMLQVLSDIDASVPIKYVWYGEWEYASEDQIGWWDSDFNDMYNDLDVNPTDAFLGNFPEKDVALTFPGALD